MSGGAFRSELRFDSESNYTLRQSVVSASVGRRLSDRFTVRLLGGAILGGSMDGEGRRYEVLPGWLAGANAAARLWGDDGQPFLVGTFSLAFSRARSREAGDAEEQALTASDARLGVQLGTTLFSHWSPYLAASAFAGPVGFRQDDADRTGSDRHHYAIGFGASASASKTVTVVFDTALVGERAVSWGLGATF